MEITRSFNLQVTEIPELLFVVSCMGISGLLVSKCEAKDEINLEVTFEKRREIWQKSLEET